MLFELGSCYITPGAMGAVLEAGQHAGQFIERHAGGDWGECDAHDAALNDRAVESGADRVFSAYRTAAGARLWVITEWDRSATTVLLPDEY
jgi:hypothetical protein